LSAPGRLSVAEKSPGFEVLPTQRDVIAIQERALAWVEQAHAGAVLRRGGNGRDIQLRRG
jgi:hypothetical protein